MILTIIICFSLFILDFTLVALGSYLNYKSLPDSLHGKLAEKLSQRQKLVNRGKDTSKVDFEIENLRYKIKIYEKSYEKEDSE